MRTTPERNPHQMTQHVYRYFVNTWQKRRACWCNRQTNSRTASGIKAEFKRGSSIKSKLVQLAYEGHGHTGIEPEFTHSK